MTSGISRWVASVGLAGGTALTAAMIATSIARADTIQWVDPVLGFRVRHQFTPNQQVFVRGDVGGFGLGSQISWQAVGAYSYAWQFTGYQIAALIGFRALGVDYVSPSGGIDAFGFNETLYGPIIGVSFRF